ncbi:hypothetical protein D046_8243B, partial [Vibrio parahaemolyticus V-223/04]
MSATGATVKFTGWLTLSPLGSVAVKVRVSEPFQSAVGVIVAMPLTIATWMLLLPETLNVNSPSTLSTSLKAVFRSIVYGVKSSAKV